MAWHLPGLFALAVILGFITCMGIGANDLANSFGTAYGSKVLTMRQLVVIAFIAEVGGATLMGATVSSTVKKGVVNVELFEDNVSRFMWGMVIALASTGMWLGVATWKSLPVSTTHSVIGAVMGFGLVEYGFADGVVWAKSKDEFPYVKGVVPVFISWFASPLVAGTLSVLMYLFLRLALLRREPTTNPILFAAVFAGIVYVTMFVNAYFILIKGMKSRVKWSQGKSAWVSALIALPLAIAALAAVMWLIRRMSNKPDTMIDAATLEAEQRAAAEADAMVERSNIRRPKQMDAHSLLQCHAEHGEAVLEARRQYMLRMFDQFQDAEVMQKMPVAPATTHKYKAERYNANVEAGLFRYLQVFTCICVAFAHGANDVANGVGPVGAVYSASKEGGIAKKSDVPIWILAGGGFAIGVGLGLFGRNILEVVGNEIVQLTPSRGFAAEFATAGTVMIASVSGLPVSTTQIITGAVIGIGLVDDWRNAVDWKLCVKIFGGWVLTIVVTVGSTALIYTPVHFAVPRCCPDESEDKSAWLLWLLLIPLGLLVWFTVWWFKCRKSEMEGKEQPGNVRALNPFSPTTSAQTVSKSQSMAIPVAAWHAPPAAANSDLDDGIVDL